MKVAFFPGSFKPPHIGHYTVVKQLLPKVDKLYILISGKPRDNITAEESKMIWNIYLSKNNKSNKNKIEFRITEKSPILEIFSLIKELNIQNEDKVYLIKSSKDKNNKRFDILKNLKINLIQKIIPKFKTISSTNMRKALMENNKELFFKFLPKILSNKEKNQIYDKIYK